jgi:hypothetical protein
MMNLHSSWAKLSALAFAAMLAAAGCSGDNSTDAGGDSGTADTGSGDSGTMDTGSSDTGSSDTGSADSGTEDTGTTDSGPGDSGPADASHGDGGGPTAECATYCSTIMANCHDANAQYVSMDACLGSCMGIPPAAAMEGDTLGCHTYHATAAAADAAVHCPHAGPSGGMVCGGLCENFCGIAMSACPGQFANPAECMTECAMWATTPLYSTMETSGNSYACRLYHLTVASSSADMAAVHCPHIVTASPTCM